MNITNEELGEIIASMDTVYTFVVESHNDYATPRDYGNGKMMNMSAIHTLTMIADNPGITAVEVAKMWNQTRSAATQSIKKLWSQGLIKKKKEDGNNKSIHLYVTEAGKELSDKHKEFDKESIRAMTMTLLEKHTKDELKTTVAVLKTGLDIIHREK